MIIQPVTYGPDVLLPSRARLKVPAKNSPALLFLSRGKEEERKTTTISCFSPAEEEQSRRIFGGNFQTRAHDGNKAAGLKVIGCKYPFFNGKDLHCPIMISKLQKPLSTACHFLFDLISYGFWNQSNWPKDFFKRIITSRHQLFMYISSTSFKTLCWLVLTFHNFSSFTDLTHHSARHQS